MEDPAFSLDYSRLRFYDVAPVDRIDKERVSAEQSQVEKQRNTPVVTGVTVSDEAGSRVSDCFFEQTRAPRDECASSFFSPFFSR